MLNKKIYFWSIRRKFFLYVKQNFLKNALQNENILKNVLWNEKFPIKKEIFQKFPIKRKFSFFYPTVTDFLHLKIFKTLHAKYQCVKIHFTITLFTRLVFHYYYFASFCCCFSFFIRKCSGNHVFFTLKHFSAFLLYH